ncbi:MAG: DNA-directed RNA polymerase subunit alpha C-terminal domain-containing protein [Planctomycetota bacterium]
MSKSSGSAGAVDTWSWYGKNPRDLDLDQMLKLKRHVLAVREHRSDLDRHAEVLSSVKESGAEESQWRGIADWLRGRYASGAGYLSTTHNGAVPAYAFAECVLHGGPTSFEGRRFRIEEALEALEGVTHSAANALKMRVLVAAGRRDDLAAALDKAGKAFGETADGCYYRGLLHEHEGEYEEADALYEKGLSLDPEHVDCLFRKAYRHDMSSEDDEAMEIYEQIAEQTPSHVNALINLGVLYEDRERYRDALYCYRRVLAVYPRHPRALLFAKDAEASLDMFYDEEQEVRQDKKNQILKIPVSDFELSVRSRNCLAKMNIVTLGDLVQKSEPELLTYKNFGETSLNEIKQILESKGLRLGMRPEDELQPVRPRPGAPGPAAPVPYAVDPNDKRLQIPVTDLALSVRSRKCLANLNIRTIGELVQYTQDELLAQRNFGVTSLKEIVEQIDGMGLSLRTVDR